jgi:hypothetical protein
MTNEALARSYLKPAFYADVDVIPTDASSVADAQQASNGALQAVEVARRVIERLS